MNNISLVVISFSESSWLVYLTITTQNRWQEKFSWAKIWWNNEFPSPSNPLISQNDKNSPRTTPTSSVHPYELVLIRKDVCLNVLTDPQKGKKIVNHWSLARCRGRKSCPKTKNSLDFWVIWNQFDIQKKSLDTALELGSEFPYLWMWSTLVTKDPAECRHIKCRGQLYSYSLHTCSKNLGILNKTLDFWPGHERVSFN